MEISIVPLAGKAYAWLFGLALGPLLLTILVLRLLQPDLRSGMLTAIVGAVLVLALGIGWAMGGNRLAVADGMVTLQASRFYRMDRPLATVDWSRAQSGDLAQLPDARTTLRTNGIGLPGYSAGWFRLAGGGRAMLMVTDPSRVIVLPFADGERMIVSVEDPGAALARLRAAAVP